MHRGIPIAWRGDWWHGDPQMRRAVLGGVAWLGVTGGFYSAFLFLELYWNLVTWRPRLDARAGTLLATILVLLGAFFWLARRTRDRFSATVSFVCCLALLALGVYTLPREPLSDGLLGRQAASPSAYRGARLVLLALPGVFWLYVRIRSRAQPQTEAARSDESVSNLASSPRRSS